MWIFTSCIRDLLVWSMCFALMCCWYRGVRWLLTLPPVHLQQKCVSPHFHIFCENISNIAQGEYISKPYHISFKGTTTLRYVAHRTQVFHHSVNKPSNSVNLFNQKLRVLNYQSGLTYSFPMFTITSFIKNFQSFKQHSAVSHFASCKWIGCILKFYETFSWQKGLFRYTC